MKQLYLLPLIIFFAACWAVPAVAQFSLYGSSQNGGYNTYSGSYSKECDQYEHGSVELQTAGPISYSLSEPLTIAENESKSWEGSIFPDMSALPEPGTSAQGTLTANMDINYSRPEGAGSVGTVVSTYECGRQGCGYHSGGQGTHEIVNQTETLNLGFTVYSVKCTVPATTRLCFTFPVNVTAQGYPGGGTYQWETSSANIQLENTSSATVKVNFVGPARGLEDIKCTYTIKEVSYEATGKVDTRLPPNMSLDRASNLFSASDRSYLGRVIGFQYVLQCLKFWSYFFDYDYDFENAGAIITSDPDIKENMDNWYREKAQEIISSGAQVRVYNQSFGWKPDEGTLLGFALGTSTYRVQGTARPECRGDGSIRVAFDVLWEISDEIDWNSYEDVVNNYGAGSWHLGFLPEHYLDFYGDVVLDGEYDFITNYEENAYVDFKD